MLIWYYYNATSFIKIKKKIRIKMKEVNLKSIVESYENLEESIFNKYLDYFSTWISITEREDLKIIVHFLNDYIDDINVFSWFFIWFIIPQIWKEFDLLKFWENYNINIELKSRNVWEDRIKDQLIKNKYYLNYLPNKSYYFTFVSNIKTIYTLDDLDNLIEINIEKFVDKLITQEYKYVDDIESLFNPSDYLVSPFNSTEKFVENKYFLTKQQIDFKNLILEEIKNKHNLFLWLTWEAWTWKTLLTYDIAKEFEEKVLVVHCWILNEWHLKLIKNFNWKIIWAKGIVSEVLESYLSWYDLIIIDETQRVYSNQFDLIVKFAKEKNISCIFSYDKSQTLWSWEENQIDIKEEENQFKTFNLTTKIRTNQEIANFIKWLFEKKRKIISYYNKSNIEINYFKTELEAKKYINNLVLNDWKKIDYTPSNRHWDYESKCSIYNIDWWTDNAHTVIWQEFEKAIVVIDNTFYYNEKYKLSSHYPNPYYVPIKMLFQIITRVRKKLNIVIINNQEVLDRCIDLLKK